MIRRLVQWAAGLVVVAVLAAGCNETTPALDAATSDARSEAGLLDQVTADLDHGNGDLTAPDQATPDGPAPNPSWVIFGGSSEGAARSMSIFVDSAGNSYVGGATSGGAITIGSKLLPAASGVSPIVAKLDPAGQVLWATTLTKATDSCTVRSIAVDAGGKIYIAGSFKGNTTLGSIALVNYGDYDGYVSQLDPQGQVLWASSFGGTGEDGPVGLVVDKGGNVFTAGHYSGTAVFGSTALTSSGSNDIFVAKLGPGGTFAWAVTGGGTDLEGSEGIALDGSGGLRVVGHVYGSGTYGSITIAPKSAEAAITARLDASGTFLWVSQADAKDITSAGVAVDAVGNSYTTGVFALSQATFGTTVLSPAASNNHVPYVAKLDPSGTYVWAVQAGDGGEPSAITVDGTGNSHITGTYPSSQTFGATTLKAVGLKDIFVAKLDAQGKWSGAVSAGGSLVDQGYGIAVDGAGNALVAGEVMFDPLDLTGLVPHTDKLTFSGQQYTVTGRRHLFAWKALASSL